MSTYLTPFDPSATLSGQITTSLGTEAGTLLLLNDSATTIVLTLADGSRRPLPAQSWRRMDVAGGNNQIRWDQSMILPITVPNSLVYIEVFTGPEAEDINEVFPSSLVRGTSVTGGVTVNTLSNEGGSVGTSVIDIGTATNPDLWHVFTDHFSIAVEQAGVAHTVLTGQAAGSPLVIGQAGDVSEVAGKLQADQGISQLGGINTSGPFGVPFFGTVTTPGGTPIATTVATTIHTVTRSAQGVFRATMLADVAGTVNTITFTLTWTDPVAGALTAHFQQSTASAFTYINGLSVVTNNLVSGVPITFVASAGTTSSLIYQNSSGVPNDHVWAFIEQLA